MIIISSFPLSPCTLSLKSGIHLRLDLRMKKLRFSPGGWHHLQCHYWRDRSVSWVLVNWLLCKTYNTGKTHSVCLHKTICSSDVSSSTMPKFFFFQCSVFCLNCNTSLQPAVPLARPDVASSLNSPFRILVLACWTTAVHLFMHSADILQTSVLFTSKIKAPLTVSSTQQDHLLFSVGHFKSSSLIRHMN